MCDAGKYHVTPHKKTPTFNFFYSLSFTFPSGCTGSSEGERGPEAAGKSTVGPIEGEADTKG